MVRFAGRLSRLETSPTLAVAKHAAELRKRGIDVIDLGPGEPDFATPENVCSAAVRAIGEGHTRYTDSNGILELRTAIADYYNERYGLDVSPAQVIAGNGGKQELFNLMLALVDEDDEVIIPSPYWVSFPQQVEIVGGSPVIVDLSADDGFRVTAEQIRSEITEHTRVLILNSPSNPTGAVIGREDLREIAELCHSEGIIVVFDETYEHFVYDGAEHASAMEWFEELSPSIVIVNSMSKTFAMTGWRIGWAVAHPDIIRALGKIQSHTTSNASSISQWAAVEGLVNGRESIGKMIEAYSERRAWLVPALAEIPGLDCEPPSGAFYVFPRVSELYSSSGIDSSASFARYLLDEARVAVVPGSAFGNDEHVRISYATSLELLKEAVGRIGEAVSKLA
ncbi:MAG: pyridoxal phosphate-dependent aminotransferase [Acidobacteria bacterium]|nr:pyridoxal phosphate-dependent aminotransferase [Acidobacteriota bacterium]